MGEYSSFYIGGKYITGWKNGVTAEAAILFTEDDATRIRHANWAEQWIYEEGDERLNDMPCFQYVSTARCLIDRLNLLGYTLEGAKEAWDAGVQRSLASLQRFEDENIYIPPSEDAPEISRLEHRRRFYESFTFDVWSGLMKRIIEEKLESIFLPEHKERGEAVKKKDPFLHHILTNWVNGHPEFGFPGEDFDYFLRAVLEMFSPDTPVVLDCSVLEEWVPAYAYTCTPPQMVVLTEGSTDRRIIEGTIKLLYPHLRGYFNFVDLDAVSMQSNTGQLVNIVKAFVAAGVVKPTLVIFDNDAAGHDALRQLTNLKLPGPIKAITLPYLPLASYYPTVGPQGSTETDINGSACSIELYLGRNTLEEAPGKLTPVRYGGFMAGVQRWQGEILDKQAVQQRYQRFLADAGANRTLLENYDLSGMRLILDSIFDQFSDIPIYNEEY